MRYTKSIPFDGDADRALEAMTSRLTLLGFRLGSTTDGEREFRGPAWPRGADPLLGATRIRVTGETRQLTIEADVRGLHPWLSWTMLAIQVIALGVAVWSWFLKVPFTRVALPLFAIVGANSALWYGLAVPKFREISQRTCDALDALLDQMAAAGQKRAASAE